MLVTLVQAPNATAYDETCSVACSTSSSQVPGASVKPASSRRSLRWNSTFPKKPNGTP